MAKDVFIIPSQGIIQFSASDGDGTGKIQADGDNLVISNTLGDVLLGDGASDVYIGDGTNNVDIIFEQNGVIKADDASSNKSVTLGSDNTNIFITGSSTIALQKDGGNVGVGTTTAGEKLEVVGNISSSGTFTTLQYGGNISGSAASTASFGKVAIGRGTPKAKQIQLSVDGGVGGTDMARFTRTLGGTGYVAINCNASMPQVKFFEDSGDKMAAIGISNLSTERANLIFATGSSIARKQAMVIENATGNVIITGSGNLVVDNLGGGGHITASGNISSSGTIVANELQDTSLTVNGGVVHLSGNGILSNTSGFTMLSEVLSVRSIANVSTTHITASGNITASGLISSKAGQVFTHRIFKQGATDPYIEATGTGDKDVAIGDTELGADGLRFTVKSSNHQSTFKAGGGAADFAKVGINVDSPSKALEVTGDISSSGGFLINHITASGNITATSGTGSFDYISATRDISSSRAVKANQYHIDEKFIIQEGTLLGQAGTVMFGDSTTPSPTGIMGSNINLRAPVTASIISASGKLVTNLIEGNSPTGFTLDIPGDITLDAAGDQIRFKDNGTTRYTFNMDSSPELDVTGDFVIDCTQTVTIDSAKKVINLIGNVTASTGHLSIIPPDAGGGAGNIIKTSGDLNSYKVELGDVDSEGNNTKLTIDDNAELITLTKPLVVSQGISGTAINLQAPVTASGNISASGTITSNAIVMPTQTTGSYDFPGAIMGYTVDGLNSAHNSVSLTTSMTPIDDLLFVSFVAPRSGNVEIEVQVGYDGGTAAVITTVGLSDQSRTDGYNAVESYYEQTNSDYDETDDAPIHHKWCVTGLTPGSKHQYWFACKTSSTFGNPKIQWGGSTSGRYIDFIMKATALPSNIISG